MEYGVGTQGSRSTDLAVKCRKSLEGTCPTQRLWMSRKDPFESAPLDVGSSPVAAFAEQDIFLNRKTFLAGASSKT
jgi:hypothetical protein